MFKRHVFLGVLTVLLVMVFIVAAHSQQKRNYNWKLLDQVKAERHSCIMIRDKKLDSGVTSEMRRAEIEYGVCVEKIIKKVATEFYQPDAFGKGGIAVRIEELRKPYQATYWTIYNEAAPCGHTGCGTMYQVFHADKWSNLMEKLLNDMVDHLKEQK